MFNLILKFFGIEPKEKKCYVPPKTKAYYRGNTLIVKEVT